MTRAVRGNDEVVLDRAATVMLVAQKLGDKTQAAAFADYIVQGWRVLVPSRHPELLRALREAAQLAIDAGWFEQALTLYTRAAAGRGGVPARELNPEASLSDCRNRVVAAHQLDPNAPIDERIAAG